MAKTEENPFLDTFEFQCGNLSQEDVAKAAYYLLLKSLKSQSSNVDFSVNLSEYELLPFSNVIKNKL